MIKWLARIGSDDPAHFLDAFRRCPKSLSLPAVELLADECENHIRVGFASDDDLVSLSVAYQIFCCAAALSTDIDFKLTWISSSIETHSMALPGLLSRWNETEEPPVLSLIALDLGERRHLTRGLMMFAGRDLEARFSKTGQSREAARLLVRLARNALMTGIIARDCAYEGSNGRALRLDWHDDLATSTLVTIVF